jgi:Tfp pilus assembly protein PilF
MYNKSAIASYRKGIELHQEGKLQESERAYRKAIKINSNFFEAHNNLGNVLLDSGKPKKALDAYRAAAKLLPDHPMLLANVGNALHNLGENGQALNWLNKALACDAEYAEAYYRRGNALNGLGRFEEAIEDFDKAIQFNPNIVGAYNNRGNVLCALGRMDEGIESIQAAVNKFPKHRGISDSLVFILNQYVPKDEHAFRYAEIQKPLRQISTENVGATEIVDETVGQLYQQCRSILDSYNIDLATSFSQLYRGGCYEASCRRHSLLFNLINIIPEECFSCYKVTLEPRSVMELFKLLLVFNQLNLPNDNTRKCIVETRAKISGTYKGLVYCKSLDEAKEVMKTVQHAVDKAIAPGMPIYVKRGCSEFPQAFPEYGRIDDARQLMQFKEEWREKELRLGKNLVGYTDKHLGGLSFNHPGFTLLDALVMGNWLAYAAAIGDDSYRQISESVLPEFPFAKRPPFQPVIEG